MKKIELFKSCLLRDIRLRVGAEFILFLISTMLFLRCRNVMNHALPFDVRYKSYVFAVLKIFSATALSKEKEINSTENVGCPLFLMIAVRQSA